MTKNRKFYTYIILIAISSIYCFMGIMDAELWSQFMIIMSSIYGGANLGEHAIYKYTGGQKQAKSKDIETGDQ